MLPFAPALLSLSVFSLFPSSPFRRLFHSFSSSSFLQLFLLPPPSFLSSASAPPTLPLLPTPFTPQLAPLPHPFTSIPPSALLSLSPAALLLLPGAPSLSPPVLCAPCLGALSPSQLGGQALPPARPCAAASGTLWWMGAVSWVPSGSTSDPVPLSPQKVEEVGAWALGQGAGLAPPPFLPAPPLSPRATHSPSPLRGVGGDITLPAKELSIKIPLLPPQLLALPPPPPQGREGSVLSSTLGSPPFPTKFRIPPDHPLLSTPRCHCSF